MNKKYALITVVLIALMSLSLIPIGAKGFIYPNGSDDKAYEKFGPRPAQLLVKVYTNYAAEISGIKGREFDIMDWGLDPTDYQWFRTNDPNNLTWSEAYYQEFGMYEWDVNDAVAPTDIAAFRIGLSYIIDKDYFLATYMPGASVKSDSPLSYLPYWYDTALTDLYNSVSRTTMDAGPPYHAPNDLDDFLSAYNALLASGYPLVKDGDSGYYMFNWTSPFTTASKSGGIPAIADGHLLVFARSDSNPARLYQGYYVKTLLETSLPAATLALQAAGDITLPGDCTNGVRIHVDLYSVPRTVTSPNVMRDFRFHIYTGGWSLGRDPDTMMLWTTSHCYPYGSNYDSYLNPDYDTAVSDMLAQPTPADSLSYAYLTQDILMEDAAFIPVWDYVGYKVYLSNWRGIVNQVGFGTNSWWSTLNGHTTGQASGDQMRYGWQGDIISLNVMSAQWLWDWEVLGRIYDSLIAVNPYNMSEDIPYLASSWSIGSWDYPGGFNFYNGWDMPETSSATKLTFTLNTTVYWQDVPEKDRSGITFDSGHEIDGPFQNMPLTPIDVAFTMEYLRDELYSWNGGLPEFVDHVAVNMTKWGYLWPYNGATKPGWYTADEDYGIPWQGPTNDPWTCDYIVNDPSLAANQIVIYLQTPMAWIGLHWIGGTPILPYHIWSAITSRDSLEVDVIGNDIIYGTGPYIYLTRTAGVSLTMVPFINGQSYRGITINEPNGRGFFWYDTSQFTPPSIQGVSGGVTGVAYSMANTGLKFQLQTTLKNNLGVPAVINYWWAYDVMGKDASGAWQVLTAGSTAPVNGYSLAIGTTTLTSTLIDGIPHFANYSRIDATLLWTYLGNLNTYSYTSFADINEGNVGISFAKLIFKENLINNAGVAKNIDYHFGYTVTWYNATKKGYQLLTSGTTPPVTGYSMAAGTSTLYQVIKLDATKLKYGDWIQVWWFFNWTYGSVFYQNDFGPQKLSVHYGDEFGGSVTFPYLGAQGDVNAFDYGPVASNWTVPPTTPTGWDSTTNPLATLAIADRNGDNYITAFDYAPVASNWQISPTWKTLTPP